MSSDRTKQICLWMTIYIYIYIYISTYTKKVIANCHQSKITSDTLMELEYADCMPCWRERPYCQTHKKDGVLDMILNYSEVPDLENLVVSSQNFITITYKFTMTLRYSICSYPIYGSNTSVWKSSIGILFTMYEFKQMIIIK